MINRQTTAALILGLAATTTSAVTETVTKDAVAHVVRDTAWDAFEWGISIGGFGVVGVTIGIIACCVRMCADANSCANCCACDCRCNKCCDNDDIERQRLTEASVTTTISEMPETPGKTDGQNDESAATSYQQPMKMVV